MSTTHVSKGHLNELARMRREFETLGTHHSLSSIDFSDPTEGARMIAIHWDQATDQATRSHDLFSEITTKIEPFLSFNNAAILELHSGPGALAQHISAYNPLSYIGVDINQSLVNYANNRHSNLKNFKWICEDSFKFLDQSFYESSFDIVFLFYEMLNTFDAAELVAFLSKVRRVLKPGGRIVGDVRTPESLNQEFSILFKESKDVLTVEETGSYREQFFLKRLRAYSLKGDLMYSQHNSLRMISEVDLVNVLSSLDYKCKYQGRILTKSRTDVAESRDNFFFIYEVGNAY